MKQILSPIITFVFLFCFSSLFGQSNSWREYLQQLSEDGTSSDQVETMFEELSDMEENPLNINNISIDDLQRIPFLSEDQRLSMIDFLEKNRPIYTVYELRNIPLLNLQTAQMMLPLFYIGEFKVEKEKQTLKNLLANGTNELQFRFDKVFPQRAGYKSVSDSILEKYPNRVYKGEDFYHSLRYSYKVGKKFQAGIVAEKDAGEAFWNETHKGYDHYGAYMMVKDFGHLKSLVLGDFRLGFGQGLVLNNTFSLGKTSATTAVLRRTTLPTRHASTAEADYFRGVAASYQLVNLILTGFYSYHNIDANLSGDSVFTSFKTDGYHRTQLEISKKGNVTEQVGGANILFQKNRLQVGGSFVFYCYDKPYQPTFQEYNRYYFRGKSNFNASIDYSYRFRQFSFAGETAISQNGSVATLNALNFYPKRGISLVVLQRNYSKSYQALYANAFSDGSSVQNESGWYVGSQFTLIPKLRMSVYADFVSFPWLKYGINSPSHSYDYLVQANYRYDANLTFDLRYRFRQRESNEKYPDDETTVVLPYNQHKVLCKATKTFSAVVSTRTMLEWNYYKSKHFDAEQGWMISQIVSLQKKKKWKSDVFIGYFNTDSYSVRVYSRERNIVNSFYMPSFSGKGMRVALVAKYDVLKNLSLAVKGGWSKYFNRDVISSGLEEIDASHRLDVMTYVRWKF